MLEFGLSSFPEIEFISKERFSNLSIISLQFFPQTAILCGRWARPVFAEYAIESKATFSLFYVKKFLYNIIKFSNASALLAEKVSKFCGSDFNTPNFESGIVGASCKMT
jgi:hypothetical protein